MVPIVELDASGRPSKLYADVLDLAREEDPGATLTDIHEYCTGLAMAWTTAGAPWDCGPFTAATVADWLLSDGLDSFSRWFRRKSVPAGAGESGPESEGQPS